MIDLKSRIKPKVSKIPKELRAKYHQVFNSAIGREVLKDILFDLYFFETAENANEVTLQNHAKFLLFKMGILTDDNHQNITNLLLRLSTSETPKQ